MLGSEPYNHAVPLMAKQVKTMIKGMRSLSSFAVFPL